MFPILFWIGGVIRIVTFDHTPLDIRPCEGCYEGAWRLGWVHGEFERGMMGVKGKTTPPRKRQVEGMIAPSPPALDSRGGGTSAVLPLPVISSLPTVVLWGCSVSISSSSSLRSRVRLSQQSLQSSATHLEDTSTKVTTLSYFSQTLEYLNRRIPDFFFFYFCRSFTIILSRCMSCTSSSKNSSWHIRMGESSTI